VLVAWAAKRVRQPVKWSCERCEAFLTDFHGRDLTSEAELAAGRQPSAFSAEISEVPSTTNPLWMRGGSEGGITPGLAVVTNAIVDALSEFGIEHRNLVPPNAMPYRNPLGLVYDSGDYPASLRRAAELADWAGFEARRAEARQRGRYRGIGIANSIELNTGAPRERAEMTIDPSGIVELVLGTMSAGQGHQTSFAQIVSEWLGVEPEQVSLITGDTDRVQAGGGSASARSMRLGAWVTAKAADEVVEKGRRVAAATLEVAEEDIEFSRQRFVVKGTDRSVGIFEAAAAALENHLPADLRGPLIGISDQVMSLPSFAYTCAVCEVEVDPETGVVDIVRYTSIDDCGRAVNPMLIHGQSHGGIAQGIGQALWEECSYDRDTAQLLSGSLMDYALRPGPGRKLPRAARCKHEQSRR
jgi:carbon-monoxide dehydrogenase large subunit